MAGHVRHIPGNAFHSPPAPEMKHNPRGPSQLGLVLLPVIAGFIAVLAFQAFIRVLLWFLKGKQNFVLMRCVRQALAISLGTRQGWGRKQISDATEFRAFLSQPLVKSRAIGQRGLPILNLMTGEAGRGIAIACAHMRVGTHTRVPMGNHLRPPLPLSGPPIPKAGPGFTIYKGGGVRRTHVLPRAVVQSAPSTQWAA